MKKETTTIGVSLQTRHTDRLREIKATMKLPVSTFVAACIDALTDDEIREVMRRHAEVEGKAFTASLQTRFGATPGPT